MWNNEATVDGLLPTDLKGLGARILRAARLATAMHLFESLQDKSSNYRQRVMIGGAGPVPCATAYADAAADDLSVTEDALSATAGVVETHQSRRPSQGAGDPFGGPGSPGGSASAPSNAPEGLTGE